MKFRVGFVSNSSNTSFCIYGVYVSDSQSQKLADVKGKNKDELFKGLYTHYSQDGDGDYVGQELSSMKDDQTFGEFKKIVADKLKEIGITEEPSVIEDGWYNG